MKFHSVFCMVIVFLLFPPGCKFFQPRPDSLLRHAGLWPPIKSRPRA
jgi:hypothetical protein